MCSVRQVFSYYAWLEHASKQMVLTRGPPRSLIGSLVGKAIKKEKQKEQAVNMPRVSINGHELNNVLCFDYLGCRVSGDGDDSADMYQRMNIAIERFSSMNHIWQDHRLSQSMKLDLYEKSVCSVFAHGSEAWTLKPAIYRAVNGFNSRCLHRITKRSYREEATEPTLDLVRALRQRRIRWLGHIMRMPEDRLLRRTVAGVAENGPPYPSGSLLMDFNVNWADIHDMAINRTVWTNYVNAI